MDIIVNFVGYKEVMHRDFSTPTPIETDIGGEAPISPNIPKEKDAQVLISMNQLIIYKE